MNSSLTALCQPCARRSTALKSGAVDLLITDNDTYVIHGPHRAPTDCTSLGPKLRPPSTRWLSRKSVCVGEAPLASHPVQWWQKSGFDIARHWVSTETRLPRRSWFFRRSLDPAIIGDYAMTYFPTFTPLPQTDLMALRDICTATAKPISREIAAGGAPMTRELMALSEDVSDAERQKQIGELIPGLSYQACSHMTPVRWPDRFVATAMITPTRITEYPYSTLIYYDWSEAQTLLTLPFQGSPPTPLGILSLKKGVGYRMMMDTPMQITEYPYSTLIDYDMTGIHYDWSEAQTLLTLPFQGSSPTLQGILSLKKGVGYRMMFHPSSSKPPICEVVFPGAVKPDWMTLASCQCRGVIDHNPALSPDDETQILSCPIKMQGQRVMWNWYTTQGRPIMFTEAAPEGTGFMLADYQDWVPGQTGQPSDIELPSACKKQGNPAAIATPSFSNPSCSDCHSTPW